MKNKGIDHQLQEFESPRQSKVRHRKSFSSITKNNSTSNENGGGLDLSLFEGAVPPETICVFCRRVLVQPEVSFCQHVFCAPCLHCHNGQSCPTCGERLQGTSQKPPIHLRRQLLNLKAHCDRKCGQVSFAVIRI